MFTLTLVTLNPQRRPVAHGKFPKPMKAFGEVVHAIIKQLSRCLDSASDRRRFGFIKSSRERIHLPQRNAKATRISPPLMNADLPRRTRARRVRAE